MSQTCQTATLDCFHSITLSARPNRRSHPIGLAVLGEFSTRWYLISINICCEFASWQKSTGGQHLINIEATILAAAKLKVIELSYNPRESIYERGAPAHFVYAVDTGALCRLRLIPKDRRSILRFLFPATALDTRSVGTTATLFRL